MKVKFIKWYSTGEYGTSSATDITLFYEEIIPFAPIPGITFKNSKGLESIPTEIVYNIDEQSFICYEEIFSLYKECQNTMFNPKGDWDKYMKYVKETTDYELSLGWKLTEVGEI